MPKRQKHDNVLLKHENSTRSSALTSYSKPMPHDHLPTVAIPDLHGGLRRFRLALSHAPPDTHHLILLGDVIDLGHDTKAILAEIRKLHEAHRLQYLAGNHEQLMIDAIYGPPGHRHPPSITPLNTREWKNWLLNGGQNTLDSYDTPAAFLDDAEWIRTHTKRWIIQNGKLYSHATRPGPNTRYSSEHQLVLDGKDALLWPRPRVPSDLPDLDPKLNGSVHGHTAKTKPTAIHDRHGKPAWFIDLGPNTNKIAIHHSETGVHICDDVPAARPGLLSALRNPLDFSGRSSVRPAKTKLN